MLIACQKCDLQSKTFTAWIDVDINATLKIVPKYILYFVSPHSHLSETLLLLLSLALVLELRPVIVYS